MKTMTGSVKAVSKSAKHSLFKLNRTSIQLLKGMGVEGDVHMGEKVKHRSRVAQNPNQPNLRQVHLIHSELFTELKSEGFHIVPGQMGENITTSHIDLLSLPRNTILAIGSSAQILITGLRNPCHQLDSIQEGLMKAVLDQDADGNLIRKAGVMAVVIESGEVFAGDDIRIEYPTKPYLSLERV